MMTKFNEEAKKALEELLETPQLKGEAQLKAMLILASGAPIVSALLTAEALIDTLANANQDTNPEFCEFVRTRLLNALAPK
jgi:hypothetical protein